MLGGVFVGLSVVNMMASMTEARYLIERDKVYNEGKEEPEKFYSVKEAATKVKEKISGTSDKKEEPKKNPTEDKKIAVNEETKTEAVLGDIIDTVVIDSKAVETPTSTSSEEPKAPKFTVVEETK